MHSTLTYGLVITQHILHNSLNSNQCGCTTGLRAVSSDISCLYSAVQENLIKSLVKHWGAMYLGLDAWQSPNGHDVLRTVLYCLVEDDTGSFELEAMPLDFVTIYARHTGVYLADTICGIVTDNASNNKTMINKIKKLKWPQFKGNTTWV
ncbi:hypothetical protein PCANC_28587 [Puccinia coronata f. sp. avenae]|uniref:DUF659 domain-containing protein n=1 Tax=Puccinia coronata f. sp. avenae TaxID=200324 RepID=A0A2N5RXK0_9BASI|nr:hypothetical protein PCANC_28587 [Puccinia coronata f. sp. avenae]